MNTACISVRIPGSKIKMRMDHGIVVDFPNESMVQRFKKKTPDDLLYDEDITQSWNGNGFLLNFNKSLNEYKITKENQELITLKYLSILDKLNIYL